MPPATPADVVVAPDAAPADAPTFGRAGETPIACLLRFRFSMRRARTGLSRREPEVGAKLSPGQRHTGRSRLSRSAPGVCPELQGNQPLARLTRLSRDPTELGSAAAEHATAPAPVPGHVDAEGDSPWRNQDSSRAIAPESFSDVPPGTPASRTNAGVLPPAGPDGTSRGKSSMVSSRGRAS